MYFPPFLPYKIFKRNEYGEIDIPIIPAITSPPATTLGTQTYNANALGQ
jgi:hypothetical protein